MRCISTDRLSEGMRLASPVKDDRGRLLLPEATTLRPQIIERIVQLGIDTVCIEDPRFEGLEFHETVDGSLRRAAQSLWSGWAAALAGGAARSCADPDAVRRLVSDLGNDMLQRRLVPVELLPVRHRAHRLAVHALNAARLALQLAAEVGLARYAVDIAAGAFVRDIGLLALPPDERDQPDPLGPQPDGPLRDHPTTALACLGGASLWAPLSKVVIAQHHERLDGSGYPNGLAGEQVHPAAALVGAIDAFLVLTDADGERPGYTPELALDYLLSCAGTSLDPRAVRGICTTVGLYPVGTVVRLSTGDEAVVTEAGCGTRQRPSVRLTASGRSLDLQEADALHVLVEAVLEA